VIRRIFEADFGRTWGSGIIFLCGSFWGMMKEKLSC